MALSPTELSLLQLFLGASSPPNGKANHPGLILDGIADDIPAIYDWLNVSELPSLGALTIILSDDELSKYLAITNWETWLGDYFGKLHNGTATYALDYPVDSMGAIARDFLSALTDHHVAGTAFRSMAKTLFDRRMGSQMIQGLVIGVSDGMFSQATGWRVYAELIGLPRWQALQLSGRPTEAEILQVLS
jgi:hypothetical protein